MVEIAPRTFSPAARAFSTTGAKRSMLSSMLQLMLRRLKASLAAANTTTSSGRVAGSAQRRLEALHVRHQHAVAHARFASDAAHDLRVVGHLRHPLRADVAGDLDLGQPRVLQAMNQVDLGLRGHRLTLVLQAVAWADVDEGDVGGEGHGRSMSLRDSPNHE